MAKIGILLVKGGILRVLETVVQMGIAFFMMPFMIKELGESSYGVWAVAVSVVGAFHLLDLGFTSAVTRYVSRYIGVKDNQATNEVISTGLVIFSLLSLVVLVLTAAVALLAKYFLNVSGDTYVIGAVIFLSGLALCIEFPFKAFAGIAYAYLRYDLVVYSRIFFAAVGGVAYYIALLNGYKLIALAVITVLLSIASNITYYLIARYAHKAMRVSRKFVNRETAKALLSFSIWSFTANIAAVLRGGIDNIIIASLMPIAAVTHYTVGYRLAEYATQAQLQATNTLTPLFAKYDARGGVDELSERIVLMTKINTMLACFCCVMLLLLGDIFIQRWVGKGYADSFNIMRALAIAFAVSLTYNPLSSAMYATAKLKSQAILELAESLVNFGLSISLGIYLGIFGVALGTAIPLVLFAFIVRPLVACTALGIPFRHHYRAVVPQFAFAAIVFVLGELLVKSSIPGSYVAIITTPVLVLPFFVWISLNVFFEAKELQILMRQLPESLQRFTGLLLLPHLRRSTALS